MRQDTFVEVDFYQDMKDGQRVCGDMFMSQKLQDEKRVVSVLADGLGSGVKASVLATLTATMATRFVANYIDIEKTATIIMNTLPVCNERKISYSTFTIVDVDGDGNARIIEYDNPTFTFIRGHEELPVEKTQYRIAVEGQGERAIAHAQFQLKHGDRIVLFSDGVTQAGMGLIGTPFGWGADKVHAFIRDLIKEDPQISARVLAKKIVKRATSFDGYKAKDDITCGVIYLREPRELLVLSGPPINKEKDRELARIVETFQGEKLICGGTTANIIARELNREIFVDLETIDPLVPPSAHMDGISLVTEGIITLGKVSDLLERGVRPDEMKDNSVAKVMTYLLDSDIIHFVVGTKINDAHQDPNMPVELEIRRNVVKKIRAVLESKYLKEVHVSYK